MPSVDGRALPPIWLEKLNAFVASHPSMAKKPKLVHEYLESLLSIPVEEGGIHSERKLPSRRWVVIQLEPWRRPDHDDLQPFHFPESFRESVDEEGIITPPLLPMEALQDAMRLYRILNERGFRRPSVRLVRNYHMVKQTVPAPERHDNKTDSFVIHMAVILSYGDSTQEANVWRYVEGLMAYQAWRDVKEFPDSYALLKEAQETREQHVGPIKADLSDSLSIDPAKRFTVQGLTMRYEQIPSRATFTKYPTPEMVRNAVDVRTNSPTYGQTIPFAFYHPSTTTTDEWLDEFSKGNVTFAFEVDRGKINDEVDQ